jgi:hypothetical protein
MISLIIGAIQTGILENASESLNYISTTWGLHATLSGMGWNSFLGVWTQGIIAT